MIRTATVAFVLLALPQHAAAAPLPKKPRLAVLVPGEPDVLTWGDERTITSNKTILEFAWRNMAAGTTGATWKAATSPFPTGMPPEATLGKGSAPLPNPGHVATFTIDFKSLFPPTPPATPSKLYVRVEGHGPTTGVADTNIVTIKYTKPGPATPLMPVPKITVGPLHPGIGMPDPQIAVGRKIVLTASTGNLAYYDRASRTWRTDLPQSAEELFRTFIPTINRRMNLPARVCDLNNPINQFVPAQPNEHPPGCIQDVYDTRIYYDSGRRRFWIATALRHPLFLCTKNGVRGVSTGKTVDPDPDNPDIPKCHTDWKPSWVHRFIAVAVSDVDANGDEDLSKPFKRFVLVDEYGDWPLMSVDQNFLILGHKETTTRTFVFDADRLARGEGDGTSMQVKPLDVFPRSCFVASLDVGLKLNLKPDSPVYPVNSDTKDGVSYLVGGAGEFLMVFGLAPPGNARRKPIVLRGAAFPLDYDFHAPNDPPWVRDGQLYYATHRAPGDTNKYVVQAMRVPVKRVGDRLVASTDPAEGFFDKAIGAGPGNDHSYLYPAMQVNDDGNILVSYVRTGFIGGGHPAEARFGILYRSEDRFRETRQLQPATAVSGAGADAREGAAVDLTGIGLDPVDRRTIWFSSTYANGTELAPVIGAVLP